jgi:hypothetical protein
MIEETKAELSQDELDRIDIFKKTYSAVYIESLSDEKINFVKERCNPVQKRLIENLKKEKTYMSDYIQGPTEIHIASLPDNKTVYLFGEHHRYTKNHCYNNFLTFSNYISELSKNTPSFFDLYVEINLDMKSRLGTINDNTIYQIIIEQLLPVDKQPEKRNKLIQFDSTKSFEFEEILEHIKNQHVNIAEDEFILSSPEIDNLFDMVGSCVDPSIRGKKECELFRIHSIDSRGSMSVIRSLENFNYFGFFRSVLMNCRNDLELVNHIFKKVKADKIFKEMFFQYENVPESIFNFIMNHNRKIKEQYEKSCFKSEIKEFMKEEALVGLITEELVNDVRQLIYNLETERQFDNELFERLFLNTNDGLAIEDFEYFFFFTNVFVMDIYALCRIFKRYDLERNLPNVFQPQESHTIIIYAGAYHTDTYKDFIFNFLSGKKIYSFVSDQMNWEDIGCVKMPESKIQFPFWLQNSELYMSSVHLGKLNPTEFQTRSNSKINNLSDFEDVIDMMILWGLNYIPDSVYDTLNNSGIEEDEYNRIKNYHSRYGSELFEALDIIYYNRRVSELSKNNKYYEKLMSLRDKKLYG